MIAVLLAVGVRQSREPSNLHAGRQIEPLHPARSDLRNRNVATDHPLLDTCYRPRRVPNRRRTSARRLEVFNHLSVVAVVVERVGDDENEWQQAAERAGMSLAAWMRDRLGKSAKRELRSGQ